MESGNPSPNILPPSTPPAEAMPAGGEGLVSPEFAANTGGEKAQAEIVKNTDTPEIEIVENTSTVAPGLVGVATDPAKFDYSDSVSRADSIKKETLEVIKKDIVAPIREGKRREANEKYQKLRKEQVKAIREKGTVL